MGGKTKKKYQFLQQKTQNTNKKVCGFKINV